MKPALTTRFLLFSLLLQAMVWALPAQAERLAHEVAHAIDHGHHQHNTPFEALGQHMDPALILDEPGEDGQQGPHHSHASEGVQLQGLPAAAALAPLQLPRSVPRMCTRLQPPSADLAGLFRPPQRLI